LLIFHVDQVLRFNSLKSYNKEKFRLLFSFLSINTIGKLFPLFLIPLLTKFLGTENYGKYILFVTYYNLLSFVIDFATQNISPKKKIKLSNKDFLSYSSNIFIFKFLIYVVSSLFILLFYLFDTINLQILFMLIVGSFATVVSPEWIYHGEKNMKFPATLTFIKEISRLLIIFCLGELLNTSIALAVYVFSNLLYSIILFYSKNDFFKFILISKVWLKNIFLENIKFFISRLNSSFFSKYNLILISFFLAPYQLAFYSIISKIVFSISDFIRPINNTLYPYLVESFNKSKVLFMKQIFYYSKVILALFTIPLLILFFLSDYILNIFIDDNEGYFSSLLGIMAFVIPIQSLTSFFSTTLLVKGSYNKILNISFFTSVIGLASIFIFGKLYGSLQIIIYVLIFTSLINLILNIKAFLK